MLVVVARIRSELDGLAGALALLGTESAVGPAVAAAAAVVGAGAAVVGTASGFVEAGVGVGGAAGEQPKTARDRTQTNARNAFLNSVLLDSEIIGSVMPGGACRPLQWCWERFKVRE